jgi:hypothetical protein
MKPLAQVVSRECLVGHGDVRAMGARGFSLGSQSTRDHATTSGKVHSGTISGFNNEEIAPFQTKDLGRPKPPEPKEEVSKTAKSTIPFFERSATAKVSLVELLIKGANMTVKQRDGGLSLVTNTSTETSSVQGVTEAIRGATRLFHNAALLIHESTIRAGDHHIPSVELRRSRTKLPNSREG